MSLREVPQRCKSIVLRKTADQSGRYKFDAVLEVRDIPSLKDGQILVKIEAAGFNHREVRPGRAFVCAIVTNLSRFGFGKGCTQVSRLAVSTAQTAQVCLVHASSVGYINERSPGTVIASSDPNDALLSRRVFLVPTRGWDSHPRGPESKFGGYRHLS